MSIWMRWRTSSDGFSGARDIKYLCDRSATIPFLKSVASGEDGDITSDILASVVNETQPSVTGEMLKRFEEWGKVAASA